MMIKFNRPILLVLITIMAGLSVLVAAITLAGQYSSEHKLHKSIDMNAIERRFQDVIADMNNFPGSAGRDVLFLRALTTSGSGDSDNIHKAAANFSAFIDKNEAYRQLYLFQAGQCAVMIDRDQPDTNCQAVPTEVIAAVQTASQLDEDDVYVSPLITISVPASARKAPFLIYASHQNDKVVVAVINADYFLEEVRRLSRPDEQVVLLDKDGSYLTNPDPAKELAAGSSNTFYSDYPAVPKGTLTNDARNLEADGKTFTFHRVYPTGGGFALSEDGVTPPSDDEYYWVIASVTDYKQVQTGWHANPYMFAVSLIVLLQLVIIGLSCLVPHMTRAQAHRGKRGSV